MTVLNERWMEVMLTEENLQAAYRQVKANGGAPRVDGKTWIVDIDLKAFFDPVNQDRLVHQLREQIGDPRVLSLIGRYLRTGMLRHGEVEARRKVGHLR